MRIAKYMYELFSRIIISDMPGSIHSDSAIEYYKSINAPPRVISILEQGYVLPFLEEKIQSFWIPNNQSFHKDYAFAESKLNEWIKGGYVVETFERPNYISALSVAIKITVEDKVKKRLCLDASHLNDLLLSEPTKLGTLELSEGLVKEGDYFTTLDLSNAYFHVKLHEKDHNKVAFAFPITNDKDEDRYRFFYFKILVYGLKPAAMVLNTLTKPLLDHLATRDIKSNIFIDDQRINNDTAVAVSEDTLIVKKVFNKAGWVFNDEKETPPEQTVYYLGLWFDSTTLRYSVHEHKIAQIERRITELEERNCLATPRELASIVGKFVSCELATTYVPRLRCHKYFSWLSKVIKTDKDWKTELHFPKPLITAFKKAVQDVKEFSGKVRRRRYNYKTIHPDQSVPCEKEFAGDGNELLGAYYSVEEPHHFKIVKYENSEGEQLSSTHRELLVLNQVSVHQLQIETERQTIRQCKDFEVNMLPGHWQDLQRIENWSRH